MTTMRSFGFRCRCGKLIVFEISEKAAPEGLITCKCGLNSSERYIYIFKEVIKLVKLATECEHEEHIERWQFIEFIFELLDPYNLWEEDKK